MFSIVTPSFKQLGWLKLCAASVADQRGVRLEHLVQDGGSGPDIESWGASQKGLNFVSEKDCGMYDAINRGLLRATGDFCAYLNCDEQYLPDALARVQACFDAHPETDVFFADAHVVDGSGNYVCTRKALIPQKAHTMVSNNLAILSCATFFRKRILQHEDLFFDSSSKAIGDVLWILGLLKRGVHMRLCGFATSTFTDTGENLSLCAQSSAERSRLFQMAPAWAQRLSPLVVAHFRLRRWIHGHYSRPPLEYAIYTQKSPHCRVAFSVARSTAIWRARL
jgi:glycosyltransferase involved in cell wall biosynthesis